MCGSMWGEPRARTGNKTRPQRPSSMKAVAKTVSGATAEIEIEGTDTLAELKVRRSQRAVAGEQAR